MTAEIAIMNKMAVALAADSAVTLETREGDQRYYYTASKLFRLSQYEPVGIMVYGTANLMEVPWETIIKTYREMLGGRSFDSIADYGASFFSFLDDSATLFPVDEEEVLFRAYVVGYFQDIVKEINHAVEDSLKAAHAVTEKQVVRYAKQDNREPLV